MVDEVARCPNCSHELYFERYNARFGNEGYMYCDSDPTVLTWSSYDPTYSRLSGNAHPWMLDQASRDRIERSVIACPHGGRFRFSASPRCPHCRAGLPELSEDPTYFVVLADRVDGDHQHVWMDPQT